MMDDGGDGGGAPGALIGGGESSRKAKGGFRVAGPVLSGETVKLTPEEEKARKRRNLMLAWSIVAFVLLVFAIALAKMQSVGPI